LCLTRNVYKEKKNVFSRSIFKSSSTSIKTTPGMIIIVLTHIATSYNPPLLIFQEDNIQILKCGNKKIAKHDLISVKYYTYT
jgi:hypothetical protein